MGTINYKTSEFITLGLKPYDVEANKNYIKDNPEEFDLTPEQVSNENFLDDFNNDIISQLYDDDKANAETEIDSYDFDYFNVSLLPGYYEGYSIDIEPLFDFYVPEAKTEALEEVSKLEKLLKNLAGMGYVVCYPGWGTSYEDYNGSIKAISDAMDDIKNEINKTEISESRVYVSEASNYQAKLNQFLQDSDKSVQQWVKKCLNNIFLGIKKDFDGYIEGKRPTIKSYGTYKILKMNIQANSDVKKDSSDVAGKWNFHYPVKDYCTGLGKFTDKKIDGDTYQCVLYNHTGDLSNDRMSRSQHDNATDQSKYPMVGCYSTGIGGSYKNLTKDSKGTTYSIIVSIPEAGQQEFTNPFMTHQGTVYNFSNDHHSQEDGKDTYTVSYDMSDGEFDIREYTEGSADRFTVIYKGRNHFKAFKDLVNQFDANTSVSTVEKILTDHGLRVEHSWWFNPYTD